MAQLLPPPALPLPRALLLQLPAAARLLLLMGPQGAVPARKQ
jgi:hypothetical protein